MSELDRFIYERLLVGLSSWCLFVILLSNGGLALEDDSGFLSQRECEGMETLQPAEVNSLSSSGSFGMLYGGAESPPLEIEHNEGWEVPKEVYPVLYKLARKWPDITHFRHLRLTPLKGAMTNQVFQCKWDQTSEEEKPRKVLVRIYGESSELFFNRENEILTFERMSHHKQGPRLLARFPNGRVEEFLHARTLTAEDLRNPDISKKIAVKLRQFHSLDMPGPATPRVWERLRRWLEKSLELAGPDLAEQFKLHSLAAEITGLEKRLGQIDQLIGFCHNDLQYGNVMIDENDHSITIIDYEYATFNPVALDIANHFCEMTADYHTDTPHILDFSKYPDYDERLRFVRYYLQTSEGEPASDSEVNTMMRAVDIYTLASHIHWALWGVISALTSDIDFNFLAYGKQRLELYYEAWPIILGNETDIGSVCQLVGRLAS